jgi:hypothetical protein
MHPGSFAVAINNQLLVTLPLSDYYQLIQSWHIDLHQSNTAIRLGHLDIFKALFALEQRVITNLTNSAVEACRAGRTFRYLLVQNLISWTSKSYTPLNMAATTATEPLSTFTLSLAARLIPLNWLLRYA